MAKSVLDTVFSIGREYTENARFAGKAEAAFRVLFQRDKKVSAEEFDAIKNQCLHKYAGGSFNIGPKEIEAIKTIYSLRMEQLLGSSYSTFVKTSQAAQPQLQKALMPKKRK